MRTLAINKQHLIWTIILGAIAALTIFFIAYNYKQQLDIQTLKSNDSQLKIIKSYIHYTEEVKAPINDEWTFYDSNMKQYTLDDIVAKGSQFCLFIDKSQCEVCWKRALTYLEENTKGTSLQPIILFSGFLPKDFVRLSTNLPFPCYYIESTIDLEEYFPTSNPLYFVLNQAKFIHYVFCPEGMYDTMGGHYLSAVTSYFNTYSHTSSTTMVIAENPQIEIKGLPLRKKTSVKLYLQNRGNKSVKIQQVLPSCDCMLIDHYPTVVKAKDKATINVSFVPDKKGWMQRSVTIILDDKQTGDFDNWVDSANVKLQITLDGNSFCHNNTRKLGGKIPTYNRILSNVISALKHKTNILLRLNYTDDNIFSFYDVIDDLNSKCNFDERKKMTISFHRVWQNVDSERLKENVINVMNAFEESGYDVENTFVSSKARCYGDMNNTVVINYDGDVYKCTARDFDNNNCEGALNSSGEIIWNNHYKKRVEASSKFEICHNCVIYPICHAGCSQNRLETPDSTVCVKGYTPIIKEQIIREIVEDRIKRLM